MRYKQLSFLLMCITAMPAWGASMCMPKTASTASSFIKINGLVDNNRGYFALGSGCVAGTTICSKPKVIGEAHCSISGVYPSDDWETVGTYCFCRLTHIVAQNGYMAPYSGAWVLSVWDGYGDGTPYPANCVAVCARDCGAIMNKSSELSRILIASTSD